MDEVDKLIYLVVTPFFPSSDRWQGAYVFDQVKAIMRHSGYEVIVFKTHTLNDKESDYTIAGIKVHCIRPLLMPSYVLNGATERIVGRRFTKTLISLGVNIDRIAFVHCHTSNHAAFGFAVRNINPKTKVILQFHDPDPLTLRNGKWADKKWNRIYRAKKSISALNKADLLLCISEHVKDTVLFFPRPRPYEVFEPSIQMLEDVADLPSLNPKSVYVLNNGVDCSVFKNNHNETKSSIFRTGCIANFNDWKNHILLVKAFKTLIDKGYKDLRLSLLGTGETRPDIVKFVITNNLSDYVEWPEEVQHDKLPDYYNTLDLFVLPSRFEGFGCVYTEAFACGVPFICTEHQGAAECISPDEKEMWLVHDQDHEHLASLIERQYKERNVQHLCKDIDIDILIPRYLEYIRTI